LRARVLPGLVQRVADKGEREVRAWSAGCASGEEPYSLRIVWAETFQCRVQDVRLVITATPGDLTRIWELEVYGP